MNPIKSFLTSRRGNFAVFAALATTPILLSMGGIVDYSRAIGERKAVAQALDAAVLAGARATEGTQASVAKQFFQANLGEKAANYTPAFSIDMNGVMTGTASGKMPTSFLQLAQLNELGINATAKAQLPKITRIVFTPTNASGWYPKDIYVFTKDRDGKILTNQKVISYDYKITTGKKTIVPSLNSATKTYELGTAYETFGLAMVVWDQFQDQRKGTTKTYYSDAADASKRLLVKGNCRPDSENHWEDGGDSNYADFEYNLKCESVNEALRLSE